MIRGAQPLKDMSFREQYLAFPQIQILYSTLLVTFKLGQLKLYLLFKQKYITVQQQDAQTPGHMASGFAICT